MEGEFLLNLKEISIQVIVISILVFALTMLIKRPIKRVTANYPENKRKAVNTVIVFIPMILSLIFSIIYYGFFESKWFGLVVYDTTVSSYILAVALYAIYSRIVIVIKGVSNQSEQIVENELDLSKETVAYINQNIQKISQALKLDKTKLENTITEIEKLLSIRSDIINNSMFQDIALAEKLENQLCELETQKENLTNSISEKTIEIENHKKTLKI